MKYVSPKLRTFRTIKISNRPFIKSYTIEMDENKLNCSSIEWCKDLMCRISEYFDVEGIILGHLKGILLLDTCKVSYSVTQTGKVTVTKYQNDWDEVEEGDVKCSIFRFDVLSYAYPKAGYAHFIQSQLESLEKHKLIKFEKQLLGVRLEQQ